MRRREFIICSLFVALSAYEATGNALAQLGFQMITLASEAQALRRGAAHHLGEATAQ